MIFITIIFSIFLITPCCNSITLVLDNHWTLFKTTFKKVYATKLESARRREIFENNVALILIHNLQENMGKHSFVLGINKMSDKDTEEHKSLTSCYQVESIDDKENFVKFDKGPHQPVALDYREKGMVGSIQNQGECGGCYAFAAMGALEAQIKLKTGILRELSTQNIIDCSRPEDKIILPPLLITLGLMKKFRKTLIIEGNKGCKNGLMIYSYQYVIDNSGVDSSSSYPYKGQAGQCKFNTSNIAGSCTAYIKIFQDDEASLYVAVGRIGPVSAGFNSNYLFRQYKSGIYDVSECDPNGLNHALLIIGYGSKDEKDYWIVKNSYGKDWGEHGYAKIARGKNMCGIARQSSFPLI